MAGVRVHAGKINGLQRTLWIRRPGLLIRARSYIPWLVSGTVVYAVALAFPLLLRQTTPVAYASAILGTILLLVGLHLRWNGETAAR